MVVLKVIPSKWTLFWLLEVIGLSGTFALLGQRATGSGSEVSDTYLAECNSAMLGKQPEGCYIYSWYFILNLHPLLITIISLLVNAIVASPKTFVARHMFGNCYRRGWLFALLLVLWILGEGLGLYFDQWMLESQVMFLVVYVIGLIGWLLFAAHKRLFCGGSQGSNASSNSFRWTWSSEFGLLYLPVSLFLFGVVVIVIAIVNGFIGPSYNILDPTWDLFLVTKALGDALYSAWLLWGLCRKDNSVTSLLSNVVVPTIAEEHEAVVESQEEESHRILPLSMNLLLGWVHANALFVAFEFCLSGFVLPYIERTGNQWVYLLLFTTSSSIWTLIGVRASASNMKGVAYWTVATWMLYRAEYCLWVWSQAVMNGSVK